MYAYACKKIQIFIIAVISMQMCHYFNYSIRVLRSVYACMLELLLL